ncbi:MAG: LysR family transcriptional regulator [Candidimonas sp.]
MIGISTRQLEVFVAIANAATVRAAAEQLCLSQPAVSMALAELERILGTTLFDRERGRLRLSPRGKELLPMAEEVVERLREILRYSGNESAALTGMVRIGTSNTVGNYLVGELLGPFMRAHPDVSLHVAVENTSAIVTGLLEHRLDAGCVEGPVNHPQLDVIPWRNDALAICAAPDHPLARAAALQPKDFAKANWLLREKGSAMRAQTEQILTGLPMGRVVLELGQVEAIKQAVIAGLGIACLPESAIQDAVDSGRLAVLHTPFLPLHRRLSLVVHTARYRGSLMNAFMRSLRLEQESGND